MKVNVYIFVLQLTWGLGGCATELEHPDRMDDAGVGGAMPIESGACAPGEEQSCTHHFTLANGQVSCFGGVQVCFEGTWSPCVESEGLERWLAGQEPGEEQ